jgi:hypothetical protein
MKPKFSKWFKEFKFNRTAYLTRDLKPLFERCWKDAQSGETDPSYRELCCYKGSCKYIANMNFNENMSTQAAVDYLTKIRCGFLKGQIYDARLKQVHYLVKSLAYKACSQKDRHAYIADALEKHSELVGISTDEYVQLLNDQK